MTELCVVHQNSSGKIVRTVTGQPYDFVSQSYTDQEYGVVLTETRPDVFQHYILNGEVTERPASPVILTGLTLEHLPVGGELFIDGTRYEITDETVELEFPLPGTFNLRVECFPYLDWTGSVTV